jgi:hypothetical protein
VRRNRGGVDVTEEYEGRCTYLGNNESCTGVFFFEHSRFFVWVLLFCWHLLRVFFESFYSVHELKAVLTYQTGAL